ncbi:MAG: HAD family hydrolase [Dehalococcoidia bacterium]|jgi:putative hydrolase of the HAD superfamily
MSKIRAVIFDCYSTLIDIKTNEHKEEIFYYLSMYLEYYGLSITPEELRASIEQEKKRIIKQKKERYPEVDLELVFRAILRKEGSDDHHVAESCCKFLRVISIDQLQLFPDSVPVLKLMKSSGYPMAIVSDAQKAFCIDEIKSLGIAHFFDHFVISSYFGFSKPDLRLFAIACSLLGIEPGETAYIGDNPIKDVKGPKKIGIHSILINRSGEPLTTEVEPDFTASDLWEAWHWIKENS